MNINYYDNVCISYRKEKPFSFSQAIYNTGVRLSEISGLYKGKTVALDVFFSSPLHGDTASMRVFDKQKTQYTRIEKVEAYAGACLKQFAAFLNEDIKMRQLHPTAFFYDVRPWPCC